MRTSKFIQPGGLAGRRVCDLRRTVAENISDKGSLCFKMLFQLVYNLEIPGKMIMVSRWCKPGITKFKTWLLLYRNRVSTHSKQVVQPLDSLEGLISSLIGFQKSTALLNPHFVSRHCACRWHHSKASPDRWKSQLSGQPVQKLQPCPNFFFDMHDCGWHWDKDGRFAVAAASLPGEVFP